MLIKMRNTVALLASLCVLSLPTHASYQKSDSSKYWDKESNNEKYEFSYSSKDDEDGDYQESDFEDAENDFEFEKGSDFWQKGEMRSSKKRFSWRDRKASKRERRQQRRMERRERIADFFEEYDGEFKEDFLDFLSAWFGDKKLQDILDKKPYYPKDKPTSPVPTPGAWILFGSALGLMGSARLKQKRS